MWLLQQGRLLEGWEEYEWRWQLKEFPTPKRPFQYEQSDRRRWRGEDLAGRTILLHAEQGVGDTIQFLRYVPLVAARGGKVILEIQRELRRLVQNIPGAQQVIIAGDELPDFQLHCPLMSLPLAFGTTLETIPADIPYLHADPGDVEKWRERLGDQSRMRIGLAWAGNPAHKKNAERSIDASLLAPLASVANVQYHSLLAMPLPKLPAGLIVTDHSNELHDFADTAALIANLDLVIAVDTAVAHLAGAMGKKVWTMVSYFPDWRWMDDREDSPWYPTLRLFRQKAPGDWASVIARVARALSEKKI
jgi:hypothetical protein